jgi:hypothetical protein
MGPPAGSRGLQAVAVGGGTMAAVLRISAHTVSWRPAGQVLKRLSFPHIIEVYQYDETRDEYKMTASATR